MPTPRSLVPILAAALVVSAGLGFAMTRPHVQPTPSASEVGHVHDVYTCPMHPQVVQDRPGQCPICGMDLVKQVRQAPPAPSAASAAPSPEGGKPVYTCPMHPQVVQDHPGSCPICGMDLVLKQAPAAVAAATGDLDGVTLSPRQRVLANVETAAVGPRALTRVLGANGRVTYDESRLQQVSAWVGGRIDRLYVNTTGQHIRRGQTMAAIYSPELVTAQQEYLTALKGQREMRLAPYPELATGARDLATASRQRLRLLGVTEAQVRQLEASGRPVTSFPIAAPASGIVIERKVQAGQYVEAGAPLFDVADLARVWVEAEVFEGDLGQVREGQAAEVRLAAFPDKVFRGEVTAILPALTAATRTSRVRIALPNGGGALKPDMYATVRLAAPVGGGQQLAVPASAVIATGRRQVVYVEVEPNRFVPRAIMVGAKTGDYYPVYKGLRAGEKVAVSGGFLLDATAQLQGQEP